MPTVAITGAGSGLGRALALKYARNNYNVYLLGRTDSKLHIVQKEILNNNGTAEVILCDIRQEASVDIAFQQMGKLDVLINNAGIGIFGPVENYKIHDIDSTIDTNIKGTIFTIQSALPLIKESKGRILTIISTAGLRGKVDESIYCASKFAIRGLTESLQQEWENEPISITAVYMGGMNTPFWDNTAHVTDPTHLKGPEVVAEQIYNEDDRRKEIIIDR